MMGKELATLQLQLAVSHDLARQLVAQVLQLEDKKEVHKEIIRPLNEGINTLALAQPSINDEECKHKICQLNFELQLWCTAEQLMMVVVHSTKAVGLLLCSCAVADT